MSAGPGSSHCIAMAGFATMRDVDTSDRGGQNGMGDKSPKNTAKTTKQKSDHKAAAKATPKK